MLIIDIVSQINICSDKNSKVSSPPKIQGAINLSSRPLQFCVSRRPEYNPVKTIAPEGHASRRAGEESCDTPRSFRVPSSPLFYPRIPSHLEAWFARQEHQSLGRWAFVRPMYDGRSCGEKRPRPPIYRS